MPHRLVSKLHIKSWLTAFYSENNGSGCRCASRPLYKDWLAVSLINQKSSICAAIMFSVSFFDCWMSLGGRWCCQTVFGRPGVAIVMQLLEDGERLLVIPQILYLSPTVVNRL